MTDQLKPKTAMRRLALLITVTVCSYGVLHVNQAWSDNTVYLEIRFDFDEQDPESADFEKRLEAQTTPRPIIGLNQKTRGNIPGIIRATLTEGDNVIEILWPGLNDTPLYSFVINSNTLAQESIEVTVSDLHFGLRPRPGTEWGRPVIAIEPNKRSKVSIRKYSETFYGILLPPSAVKAVLVYSNYSIGTEEPQEIEEPPQITTIAYKKRTFTEWNDAPHVTRSLEAAGLAAAPVERYAYKGTLETVGPEDFQSKLHNASFTDAGEPIRSWLLITEPGGASITMGGNLLKEITETTKDLRESEAETIVFEMQDFVQCPYDDAIKDRESLGPSKIIMKCEMEKAPTRGNNAPNP